MADEAKYRSAIPSGETEAEAVKNIMAYYRVSNKVLNKMKERVDAPIFKSVDAAHLLATCPKFSSQVLETSPGGPGQPVVPAAEQPESGAGPSDAVATPGATGERRVVSAIPEPPDAVPAIPAPKRSAARPRGVNGRRLLWTSPTPLVPPSSAWMIR